MKERSSALKAMILAAGHGTRLRPLTNRLPKCMVSLAGKPLLEHTIEWLASSGISEIIINVSHLGDVLMDHFGDGREWGVRIQYSVEERPLGTAGGVRNAARFFEGSFLVWYGDNYSKCDVNRLHRFHMEKGGLATVCLHRREEVGQSGIVELDDEARVIRFVEKPSTDEVFSNWVNAGIYLLEQRVIDLIPREGTPDFGHDVFPSMLSRHAVFGYRLSDEEGLGWVDRPEDLQRLQSGVRQ